MPGVGIDVSKAELVVHMNPSGWHRTFENSKKGRNMLLKCVLKRAKGHVVVMEPTAQLHLPLARLLHAKGVPVMLANPRRARAFATSMGRRAKTDRVDSELLALFASTHEFRAWQPPRQEAQQLRQLTRRRDQLVRMRAKEKTRLKELQTLGDVPELVTDAEEVIAFLDERIDALEASTARHVAADAALARDVELVDTVPGIAAVTATNLVSELTHLPEDLDDKQATAYVGLDPSVRQSGRRDAKRHISKAGNRRLRSSLYMAAWNAATHSPHVKAWKEKKLAEGKEPNVVYVAIARRLLMAIRAMLRSGTTWQGERFCALN